MNQYELRLVLVVLTIFLWCMSSLFALEYLEWDRHKKRYCISMLFSLAALLGFFMADNFYFAFICFEVLTFTTYLWVVHDESPKSKEAGATYLTAGIMGGFVTLMGLILLQHEIGTLEYDKVLKLCSLYPDQERLYGIGICLVFGFFVKAGVVPLHIWLPKAHTAAPAPASALLSGIVTKTGIYGIFLVSSCVFFQDTVFGEFLLKIGLVTMVTGAVLALNSSNIKRTLACSSISQLGFIITGLARQSMPGAGMEHAAEGTLLFIINHALFKLVLFLIAGTVVMNVHQLNYTLIQGFGRKKKLLKAAFILAALGMAGIPGISGYMAKTLLHEGIVAYGGLELTNFIFLLSGGMTAAYLLRLYQILFVYQNEDSLVQESYDKDELGYHKYSTVLSILLPMGVIIAVSLRTFSFTYYELTHLSGILYSLSMGLLVYLLVYRCRKPDIRKGREYSLLEEKLYRPLLMHVLPLVFGIAARFLDILLDSIIVFLRKTIYRDSTLPKELMEGNFLTHEAGYLLDHSVGRIRKKSALEYYEHRLALISYLISENNTIIARSLSFGLLLFTLGLLMTLFYVLL